MHGRRGTGAPVTECRSAEAPKHWIHEQMREQQKETPSIANKVGDTQEDLLKEHFALLSHFCGGDTATLIS